MNKTILFDFDGTIVDSGEYIIEIYNEIAKKYNYKELDSDNLNILRKISIKERCNILKVPMHMLPILALELKKTFKKYISELKLIDGIQELLYELKNKGYNLSVLSSNSVDTIQIYLQNKDINVFDNVFSAKNIFGKHTVIKKIMRKNYIKNSDLIYIGDEIRDIISCKKCNVKVIAATWGFDHKSLLEKEYPTFIVNKPFEILDVIGKIN